MSQTVIPELDSSLSSSNDAPTSAQTGSALRQQLAEAIAACHKAVKNAEAELEVGVPPFAFTFSRVVFLTAKCAEQAAEARQREACLASMKTMATSIRARSEAEQELYTHRRRDLRKRSRAVRALLHKKSVRFTVRVLLMWLRCSRGSPAPAHCVSLQVCVGVAHEAHRVPSHAAI